jgi:hypothetical protein
MSFSTARAFSVPILALLAAPALAVDLPTMKPGLWESQVTRDAAPSKAPSPATKMCIDAATQKEMMDMGMGAAKSMCAKNDIRRDGNKVYGSSECKIGDSTMKAQSTTVFSGDTSYKIDADASYDPPFMGKSSSKTHIDAKWTGPCPPDMQPGDVMLPGGQKINMHSVMGGGSMGGGTQGGGTPAPK